MSPRLSANSFCCRRISRASRACFSSFSASNWPGTTIRSAPSGPTTRICPISRFRRGFCILVIGAAKVRRAPDGTTAMSSRKAPIRGRSVTADGKRRQPRRGTTMPSRMRRQGSSLPTVSALLVANFETLVSDPTAGEPAASGHPIVAIGHHARQCRGGDPFRGQTDRPRRSAWRCTCLCGSTAEHGDQGLETAR